MPVTRRGNPLYDNIDQTNAAGFLFRDDESTMDSNYNGLKNGGDDGFPKLIAQKSNPNRVSLLPIAEIPSSLIQILPCIVGRHVTFNLVAGIITMVLLFTALIVARCDLPTPPRLLWLKTMPLTINHTGPGITVWNSCPNKSSCALSLTSAFRVATPFCPFR